MIKAAAYCRVSTDRQRDEKTIESQEMEIKDWAKENDAIVVDWYKDDGWSGDMLARPELDRLRDDVSKGIWETVVILDRDRLARRLAYQELVIDELREQQIEVVFLSEPLAEDYEGRVLQQVKGIFAEYERAKTAERMRRGKMKKAKSGKIVGNNAPFGYDYIPKVKDKDGYYKINKVDAEIVKIIYRLVGDEGYTIYQIIQELYAKGTMPPKGKRNVWGKSTVRRMLHNETYIGTAHYNKTKAVVPKNPIKNGKYKKIKKSSRTLKSRDKWIAIPVPKIIDRQLFDRVQKRLKENERFKKGFRKHDYLLTGLVKCKCGYNRVGDSVHKHHYYRCASRIYKFPKPSDCKYEGINADVLDKMAWEKLLELLGRSEKIKEHAREWVDGQESSDSKTEAQISNLQVAIDQLKDEQRQYSKLFAQKLIDFDILKSHLRDVGARRKTLVGEIEKAKNYTAEDEIPLDDIEDVCQAILQTVKYASQKDKKKYVQKLVSEITVGERREALVKGYIPLPKESLNIRYGSISRDWHQAPSSLDFKFAFEIPAPRNWRIISERDELGRIVKSGVPPVFNTQ